MMPSCVPVTPGIACSYQMTQRGQLYVHVYTVNGPVPAAVIIGGKAVTTGSAEYIHCLCCCALVSNVRQLVSNIRQLGIGVSPAK